MFHSFSKFQTQKGTFTELTKALGKKKFQRKIRCYEAETQTNKKIHAYFYSDQGLTFTIEHRTRYKCTFENQICNMLYRVQRPCTLQNIVLQWGTLGDPKIRKPKWILHSETKIETQIQTQTQTQIKTQNRNPNPNRNPNQNPNPNQNGNPNRNLNPNSNSNRNLNRNPNRVRSVSYTHLTLPTKA